MKKLMSWGGLAVLALVSCKKKPEAPVVPPVEHIVASTPEPNLVAPGGVFFLLKKTTLETDSGVINYRPGTKVHRAGNRYIAGDGRQLNLRPDQITNNLQQAQIAAGNDAAAQAIIRASVQTARTIQSPSPVKGGATPRSK